MQYSQEPAERRYFAVVYYVADPLGSMLRQLCGSISGFDRPQAHITLLPPRPLLVPLEEATRLVRNVLKSFGPFEVELSAVQEFPKTKVLYLGIGKGSDTLEELHARLNKGGLAFEEEFDYLPHVTLSGPIERAEIAERRKAAEAFWGSVTCVRKLFVDEAVLLCQEGSASAEWRRVWVESMDAVKAAHL